MTKKDRYLLYIMAAGLSVMLILRDINGISISKFIIFGYVVAFMAAANYQTLVNMICFILPLVCGLPGTYIMPCAFALLLIKKGNFKLMQVIPVVFILLLELFAAFWYPSMQLAPIIQYVFFAGTVIFLIHDERELDYQRCIKLYMLGVLLLCGVILYATLMDAPKNWLKQFAEGLFRFGDAHVDEAKMQLTLNANSLAYYSLTGITCSLLLTERTAGVKKIWYIALVLFFAVVGFLTVSRSWVLVAAGCLLLYVLSKLRKPKYFMILLLAIAVLALCATIYLNTNPEMLAGFEARFNDDTVESGGGRIRIFSNYMKVYFSNFRFMLFGTGVTQYTAVAQMAGSVHNGTQQILVCCGIIGFVLYMAALIIPVLRARRKRKLPMIYWLPLISMVVFIQTIQFLNPMMLMLPYIIGIYALRAGGQNNENISDNGGHRGGRPVELETR